MVWGFSLSAEICVPERHEIRNAVAYGNTKFLRNDHDADPVVQDRG